MFSNGQYMNRLKRSFSHLSLSLCFCACLVACKGSNPAELLVSAKDYIAKNDHTAAIIQLKNALQQKPDDSEARLLLGKSLLATGDAEGAESELRKALSGGQTQDAVVPALAEAMLTKQQFKKLEDAYGTTVLKEPASQASLLTSLASARMGLGQSARALETLDAALKVQPDHVPALVEKARFLAGGKRYGDALSLLETVLKLDPRHAVALKLKGDVLYYGQKQPDAALKAYQTALEHWPSFHDAQYSIVRVLLSQGKFDEAVDALNKLKKMAAQRPSTAFIEAQVAMARGDLRAAREAAQRVLKVSPDNALALELAGAIEYQANALIQAQPFLAKALRASPELTLARRMLVLSYLKTGQTEKAMSTLPTDLAQSNDAEMLAAAGQVYMVLGNQALAQTHFERASRLDPVDPSKKTSLALSRLMDGRAEQAFGELQDISTKDKGVVADMALVNALVQRRELDKALAAVLRLAAKRPGDPIPAMLHGQVLLLKGNIQAAQEVLGAALKATPAFFPAVKALAAIDVAQKKQDVAVRRVEAFLENEPKHVNALMYLAELQITSGVARDKTRALLSRAVEASPDDEAPRLMLIAFLLHGKEPKQALTIAQNAAAALPGSVAVLGALGQAQAAAGERNQALSTYGKLASVQPQSGLAYMRMAGIHAANNDLVQAALMMRKALEAEPDHLEAQHGLAKLALRNNSVPEAIALVKDIQRQRPKDPIGFVMEGDVHVHVKQYSPAVSAYASALEKAPAATGVATKLHSTYLVMGASMEAEKLATGWMLKHPRDAGFAFYMGERAMIEGRLSLAEKHYQVALSLQPSNPLILNNMAWVLGKMGRKEALGHVEKAAALAPDTPEILDTWSMVLAGQQQWAKAVELQRKAVELKPAATEFRLSLAKLQLQAGQKVAAKESLLVLRQLGSRYGKQAEVDALLKGL